MPPMTSHKSGSSFKFDLKPLLTGALLAFMACSFSATSLFAMSGTKSSGNPNCKTTGNFSDWLSNFKQEAAAKGISSGTISTMLDHVQFDAKVIQLDRRQNVFSQPFLTFAGRMVAPYRIQKGSQLIKQHKATFQRIEKEFGVPAAVLVAFWGLETDFGSNNGNMDSVRSLATLAFDCRRPEMFREQLHAALKIVENGDLRPEEMRGPWAGELGQMQFLPAHYLNYGVDFDGDGHRNLIRSVPDVLASSANYLKNLGWKRGEPWLQEVQVPADMPWDQADMDIEHPRSKWSSWGVTSANGKALPQDNMQASLLLPMGRNGPAFLAYHNFKKIYLEWNQSLVYSTTAAYFATRLNGAGPVRPGNAPVDELSFAETKELQTLLKKQGHDVGKVDGILGAGTREAIKKMQIKFGLPADSYPTHELLNKLR